MRKYVCTVTRPLLVVKGPNGHKIEPRKGRGAHARIRTGDLFLTKEMLYRLSYVGARVPSAKASQIVASAPTAPRVTPGGRLKRRRSDPSSRNRPTSTPKHPTRTR